MKKLLAGILGVAMCGAAVFGMAACKEKDPPSWKTFTVYAPDGAPALALANLVAEEKGVTDATVSFQTTIVQAATIQAQVQTPAGGGEPKADFCVLPVNAAAKLLGSGEKYQMLGTVTNGNMYFLTTGTNPEITSDNLSTLVGKTVGVVQLANVPGLTFQSVLKANNIEYNILGNDNEANADMVNLKAFQDAQTVLPSAGCDYYLCPEPAVTAKINGTASSPKPFKHAGSLQVLAGGGYPQAVMVARKSVITDCPEAVTKMISYLEKSHDYLAAETTTATDVLAALESCYDNFAPSLTAGNLNKTVIANCSVKFTPSKDCKETVNAFLASLIEIAPDFTTTVSENFYYLG